MPARKPKRLWIPADRFLHIIDACRIENVDLGDAGIRRVFELRSGAQAFIELGTADRLLTRLGLQHWFHRPKEQGGLADIYVDGVQYGKPDPASGVYVTRPYPRRYATDEERLEARRAKDRRYKQKKREEEAA